MFGAGPSLKGSIPDPVAEKLSQSDITARPIPQKNATTNRQGTFLPIDSRGPNKGFTRLVLARAQPLVQLPSAY